ncbi:MAG: alpha-glucan family phosphorylase [Dehalococcoidia bacterium]|nr:alpha-glucan family phosphorylase [Dehalococcoidia bacterium]
MPVASVYDQLTELATNYRWSWSPAIQALFDRLPGGPAIPGQHPLARVLAVGPGRVEADAGLAEEIARQHALLRAELDAAPRERSVAYFSPEFAISETFPQYSGGLGVLAGDHLKAASDERLPLVGVGLLYREGFFHQAIEHGGQVERYTEASPQFSGVTDTGVRVRVQLDGHSVLVAVWRVDVGSVPLYLLDTHLPENSPDLRNVTDRLYHGDREHRLNQEVVLGVGGVRALQALGIHPDVYHLNEGHSAFLLLELLHDALAHGDTFPEALENVRARARFTTHTPVPAGIDRFDDTLVHRYLGPWARRHRIAEDDLLALGRMPSDPPAVFNLAAFCLRLTGEANGVSRLHGGVSRDLFHGIERSERIFSVTNGVHARSWVRHDLQETFDEHLGSGWATGVESAWARTASIPTEAIRRQRTAARGALIEYARAQALSAAPNLDPAALTIGFARRFAPYKRATLFLHDRPRIEAILASAERPVQFIVAGKAHPADHEGKALVRELLEFVGDPASRGRVVFIPDYDMAVARLLVAGSDVWLNNPLRPYEACGTSGMKAALNGSLNLSTLDGWWDEAHDGRNGWAIPSSEADDLSVRNDLEAASLLDLLDHEVIPLFYADGRAGTSDAWIARMRESWSSLGAFLTASRMVREYAQAYYELARAPI